MSNEQRQHPRIQKSITLQYRVADTYPSRWDMSTIENISAGGVKFAAFIHQELNGKTLHLQIKMPELAPHTLHLQAQVLAADPRPNGKMAHIRAKFINLSEQDKADLAIIEKIIHQHQKKQK